MVSNYQMKVWISFGGCDISHLGMGAEKGTETSNFPMSL